MPCSRFLPALCIASLTGLIAVLPVAAQITVTADDFTALLGRSFIEELYSSTENEAAAALADQSGPNQTWDLAPLTFEPAAGLFAFSYVGTPDEVPGGDDPAFASANWIIIEEGEEAREVTFSQLVPDSMIVLGNITSYYEADDDLLVGRAMAESYLGLIATGDASIRAAMEDGGITEVVYVDYESTSILGLYATFTVVVYGR